MSSHFQGTRTDIKKVYDNAIKKAEKNIIDDPLMKGNSIDPKRQISSSDKEIVWQQATSHPCFDESIFRCDPLGSIAIKGLSYTNTSCTQKKFVMDYEHIVSHSENGRSVIENICILNAGINRAKGSKPLTSVNFYEFQGLVKIKSITFDQLFDDLENNLHSACEHYELYFYKNNQGKWTIHRSNDERKYQNYLSSNSYKPRKRQMVLHHDDDINLDTKIVVGSVAVSGFLVLANAVGTQIYKGGERIVTYVDDILFKKDAGNIESLPELPKKKEEPSAFTATAIGSLFLGAVAFGLKAYTDAEFKTEKNKNKRKHR